MKILRTSVAAAASLALLVQIASVQAQTKWQKFQPSGAGYRIEFPGTPAVTKDTLPSRAGPAPRLAAELSYASNTYSVELTTYAAASPPEAVLDLFASTFAKDGYRVRKQTPVKIGSDVGRRFEVEMVEGKVVVTVLIVTDGTRVYQVSCISLKGKEHSPDVQHFINSFALVP